MPASPYIIAYGEEEGVAPKYPVSACNCAASPSGHVLSKTGKLECLADLTHLFGRASCAVPVSFQHPLCVGVL